MVRHRRSFLQRAAVLEVRSDPGRSEAVVAELGGDAGCRGSRDRRAWVYPQRPVNARPLARPARLLSADLARLAGSREPTRGAVDSRARGRADVFGDAMITSRRRFRSRARSRSSRSRRQYSRIAAAAVLVNWRDFRLGLLRAPKVRFATDSPLEGAGFELSVPRQESRRFEPASVPSRGGRCRRGGYGPGGDRPPSWHSLSPNVIR